MLRSSTSSSDPPARWRKVALVALLVIVAAEAILRLPLVESAIGPPSIYYQPEVQERLEALAAVEAERGEVDVLFVGSSVARSNISPLVFDAELAAAGYDVVSFTGGLGGMRIDPARLYLERLWLEESVPDVVVQAVRYEFVAESAPVEAFWPFDHGKYEQLWLSDSPLAPVQEAALSRSRLIQYAGLLTGALARPESALVPDAVPIDERGFTGATGKLIGDRRPIVEIPGGDAAVHGYQAPLNDAAFEALSETIALVRQSGADYVLLNMPEHRARFGPQPRGQELYLRYVNALAEFAAEQGVPFIDLTGGDVNAFDDDKLWANYIYFTTEAAEALTRLLAATFAGDDATARLLREGR